MKKTYYLLLTLLLFACNKKADETKTTTNSSTENNKTVEKTNDVDLSTEENKLLKIHNDISNAMGNMRNDSLLALSSQQFTDSLTYLIKNNNSTLNYPFEKLQKENALKMATSADKKLRVYSWDNNWVEPCAFLIRFINLMQTETSRLMQVWHQMILKLTFQRFTPFKIKITKVFIW